MIEHYDVVVVGAGLSGLRMARLLAEAHLRVLLADGKTDLRGGIHTTGIFVRRTLTSFPLPPECLGPPVRHVTLYSPAGRPLRLESPREEFRIGRMAPLYEHELDRARHAGAEWAPGCRFEGLEFLRTDTLAQLRDAEGAPRLVRTRFLVGADGTFSTAARNLKLDTNREWIVGVEEVLHGVETLGPPRLHVILDPELAPGYIAWVAYDGHEFHLGAGGRPARFKAAQALEAVRAVAGDLLYREGLLASPHQLHRAAAPAAERRAGAIPVGGILERLASTRGLLVGDAAGAPSPLTAGGLDPCLRLTATAAEAVVGHLARGHSTALADYRGGAFRPRFAARLAMRRLFDSLGDPRLLEAVCLGLRAVPFNLAARRLFFAEASFPDIPFPDTPSPSRTRPERAIMRT